MAYKCENCGSTNIKVDYKVAYTSLPEKYGYCCQDCGEKGFVTRNEVVEDYLEDLFNLCTTFKTPRDIVDRSGNEELNEKIKNKIKIKEKEEDLLDGFVQNVEDVIRLSQLCVHFVIIIIWTSLKLLVK